MLLKPITTVLAIAITISAECLAQSPAQPKQTQTASSKVDALLGDLRVIVEGLGDDSGTLNEMASSSLQSIERDNAISLVDAIQLAMTEVGGASWLIEPYNKMGCDQDRETMKGILQERLKSYSHLLDLNIDVLSHHLPFTRLPAVSQVVLRAQDRMRNAKRDMHSVLDAIQ